MQKQDASTEKAAHTQTHIFFLPFFPVNTQQTNGSLDPDEKPTSMVSPQRRRFAPLGMGQEAPECHLRIFVKHPWRRIQYIHDYIFVLLNSEKKATYISCTQLPRSNGGACTASLYSAREISTILQDP